MMISCHSDLSENMQRWDEYIKALEEERRKIQVFQRELPLCLQLVTQAIETCKQQLSGSIRTEYNLKVQSECREHTSSDIPILEEFIPMKRASSYSDEDEEEHDSNSKKSKINESSDCDNDGKNSSDKNNKKSDWLRSVQLWNQTTPDPPFKDGSATQFTASELKSNVDGDSQPLKKLERGVVSEGTAAPASTSSTAENGGARGNKKEEKESQRKARRCWSPELHRRFLQALQQLGGSHVATPKQIRALMKVDGLTNDEVKSHLQKYRLHTRRPLPSTQNNNAQTPHVVVVGGLWMPPEYASMATTTTSVEAPGNATSKGIYAPVAALPPPFQEPPPSPHRRQRVKPSSKSNGGAQSCSAATSSSIHTTAAVSPAC